MILAVRNKQPQITFGLGQFTKTVAVGERVNVWQGQTYLAGRYNSVLKTTLIPKKESEYHYILTPYLVGIYEIYIEVSTKDNSMKRKSNKIILTVVE